MPPKSQLQGLVAKLPPQNLEIEQAVLGAILLDKDALIKIADQLAPSDFYRPEHQDIFRACITLFEKRQPLDLLTLSDLLEKEGKLARVGGVAYLSNLTNVVVSGAHVSAHADIVKANATLRQLVAAGSKIVELGYRAEEDPNELLTEAEQTLFAISQKYAKQAFTPIRDILTTTFERIDELHKQKGKLRGITTGFQKLDHLLAGLQASDLIIIAARPSIGKSSLALNIATHAAIKEKVPVGIFSLEMSRDQLVDRLLVSEAGIDSWKLRTGNLSDDDFPRIGYAMGLLSEAPIYIDDSPILTPTDLRARARRLQVEQGLGLLIVDYLQLMEGRKRSGDQNRVQEISEISRGLKAVARELNIPVLALSQLSRAVEQRSPKIPQLADLRESGCVAGDTQIMLPQTGEITTIAQVVERQDLTTILSMRGDLKIIPQQTLHVFATGRKQIFTLKTASGKKIRATGNHKFYTLDGWKRLDELNITEAIAAPRIISYQPSATMDKPRLGLLAHLIGDGCVLARQPIHYTSADVQNLEYVEQAAHAIFSIAPKRVRQQNWYHSYLSSPYRLTHGRHNPIVQWFIELGIDNRRAGEKIIPSIIFQLPAAQIAHFIYHLWATDGSVSYNQRNGTIRIYYASKSEQLIRQLQHLLLRFGITGRIKWSKKGDYAPTWHIDISGKTDQLLFAQQIGIFGTRGAILAHEIKKLYGVNANPNVDVIPRSIWKHIEGLRQTHGLTTREFHTAMGWAYSGTQRQGNGISRTRLQAITQVLPDVLLHNLAQSDVLWDKIVAIEPGTIEPVYDLTIAHTHNFVANDIIVHNSIEQDADVVMFIYREDYYEPKSERKNIADILIKKHRHGPTGELELYFRQEQMKFETLEKKVGIEAGPES
ncbi:replicative DNA helicase [Candidatus Berkelbacteria bacterium]|nr:replicative DNA helicase [Candidatus Berkelbacteria bacterium]